jgi:predicted dehydrogenase
MRLIQVGLGGWGLDWAARVLPLVPGVETVAFVDADPAARLRAGQRLGLAPAQMFPSLEAALGAVAADSVLATVPAAAHAAVADAALRAGMHVLVEKPFTATLAEGAELVALAAARGRVLMVSQNYRFFPAIVTAARLLRAGGFGAPLSASITFRKDWRATGHRYHDIPGPLLLDMAIHHFDLLRMLLGEVAELACKSWNTPESPFREHAAAQAIVQMRRGIVVGYHGSWLSRDLPTLWSGEWRVECEDGVLVFAARGMGGALDDWLELHTQDGTVRRLPLDDVALVDRAGTLAAFAAAVAGDVPANFPSGADNLRSLALSFAAVRSAASGGRWTEPAELLETVAP